MSCEPAPVKAAPPLGASKADWRRWARRQRTHHRSAAVSEAVVAGALPLVRRMDPTTVVAFAAMGDEVDVAALVAADPRHRWALTRTPASGPLTLHSWSAPRERHPFGFEQPVAGAPGISPVEVGAVVVPGLVFDEFGTRLGYGRGYYDVLLAACPKGAARIGVVADPLLVAATLPRESHDMVMTAVVTDRRTVVM